ncbi:MAG: ADOP family duplicated permease [Terriglobales bacterium]
MRSLFLQEVALSLRRLRRDLLPSLLTVAMLALGLGANAAFFSIGLKALFETPPFDRHDQLAALRRPGQSGPLGQFSRQELSALRESDKDFRGVSAYMPSSGVVADERGQSEVGGYMVDRHFFRVVGMHPLLGRAFRRADEQAGAEPSLILSYSLWRRGYAGERDIVGRQIEFDGTPHTVLGVMPPGFHFPKTSLPFLSFQTDVWLPLPPAQATGLRALVRLRPGVTLSAARASLAQRLLRSHGRHVLPITLAPVSQVAWPAFLVLGALSLAAVLVTCASLAGLQLAQATARRRELAIRAALGASRWRNVRLLLLPASILGVAGAAAGGMLGVWLARLLPSLVPPQLTVTVDFSPDWRVVSAALGLAFAATLIASTGPALAATRASRVQSGRGNPNADPRGASANVHRTRSLLVAGQFAAAMALVVLIGLFAISLRRILQVNPGFRLDHLLAFVAVPSRRAFATPAAGLALYTRMREQIGSFPGVKGVAITSAVPIGGLAISTVRIRGMRHGTGRNPEANFADVTANFFSLLGLPLLAGRSFGAGDGPGGAPVALVNEAFARRFFRKKPAVGQYLCQPSGQPGGQCVWREVVGVVGDMKQNGLEKPTQPAFYLPLAQSTPGSVVFCVRTRAAPEALEAVLEKRLTNLDPGVAIPFTFTSDDIRRLATLPQRALLWVLGVIALLTVLLAAGGTFAVATTAVEQRRREIGIRLALGATPGRVAGLLARHTLRLLAWGLGCGAILALTAAQLARHLLYGVAPSDPIVLVAAAALVTAVALLSILGPLRDAMRADPAVALRSE